MVDQSADYALTDAEVFDFCERARHAGYAITAFTNEELRGCDPRDVVDAMIEAGNERIDFLAGPEDDEDDDPDHRYNPAPFCGKCSGPCQMPHDEGTHNDRSEPHAG